MKRLLLLLILFCSLTLNAQTIHTYDTIINMHYYKAYYSKSIKASSFVIYKLYKGGGDVNRASYQFKGWRDLPYFDYYKSGYDRGHLVPAEDLADSNIRLKSTFYYINCVPQHPTLNRGIWKRYENITRKLSQEDSLLIVCGGCDYSRTKANKCIPKNCFKVVYSLTTKECLFGVIFPNDSSARYEENKELKNKFTYKRTINLFNKK